MDNRMILNREYINTLFTHLFHQILDIEAGYLRSKGITDLSMSEMHLLDDTATLFYPTMSEIAQAASLTNGTVTTSIKKLEGKGYVTRKRDEHDKRIIRVELTHKGFQAVGHHNAFHEDMVDAICKKTDITTNEVLMQSLRQLTYFFEDMKESY